MELTIEEIYNRADCVLNSLNEGTKNMIRYGDDHAAKHAMDAVCDMIYELNSDLDDPETFNAIEDTVYECIRMEPITTGSRRAE